MLPAGKCYATDSQDTSSHTKALWQAKNHSIIQVAFPFLPDGEPGSLPVGNVLSKEVGQVVP